LYADRPTGTGTWQQPRPEHLWRRRLCFFAGAWHSLSRSSPAPQIDPQVLMTWSPLLGSVNGDHQLRRDLAAQDDELVVLHRQDERPIVEAPPPAAPGAVGHVPVPEGLEDGYAGADDAHGGVFERDAHDLEGAVAKEEAQRRLACVASEVEPRPAGSTRP